MSQQKEIELKLELPPGNVGALDRLSFLKGIKPAKAKTLLSVYFDTSDQKLRRKGVSLRIGASMAGIFKLSSSAAIPVSACFPVMNGNVMSKADSRTSMPRAVRC